MKQSLPPNAYWVEPGCFAAGEYPGSIRPEDGRIKIRQLLASGIRLFLDLTEEDELLPYTDILREEAGRAGTGRAGTGGAAGGTGVEVRWQRMPIQDASTPSGTRMAQIQAALADAIQRGVPVYVHCWGGVGRTGTVVGCFLVESGLSGHEALARLRTLWQNVEKRHRRPRTPENSEQEQFVLAWKPAGGTAYEAAVDRVPPVDRQTRISGCLNRALGLHHRGLAPTPEIVEQIGQGWIAEEALAIAVFCALAYHDDFRRAVLLAVNHSGDSDSTGAITGNLLGALLGVDAIPTKWLEPLELRQEIEAIAQDLQAQYHDDESWRQRYPGC